MDGVAPEDAVAVAVVAVVVLERAVERRTGCSFGWGGGGEKRAMTAKAAKTERRLMEHKRGGYHQLNDAYGLRANFRGSEHAR